jgi:hypothetical protein
MGIGAMGVMLIAASVNAATNDLTVKSQKIEK